MLDDMFDYIERIRARPVWLPMDPAARSALRAELPVQPTDLAEVVRQTADLFGLFCRDGVRIGRHSNLVED